MSPGPVAFRAFGPLSVTRASTTLETGGHRERAVLAALLLSAGERATVERLTAVAWGASAPRQPDHALQTHVMRLRHHLGADLIVTEPHGYRLDVDRSSCDVHRFDAHLVEADQAVAAGDLAGGEGHYAAALAEAGRGQPWPDLVESPTGLGERARLAELRLLTEERRAALRHVLGLPSNGEVERLAAEQPLREARWGLLMRTQVAAGRQADALRSYTRARELLQSELGIDPSPGLRRLEGRILRQDPALLAPTLPDVMPDLASQHAG